MSPIRKSLLGLFRSEIGFSEAIIFQAPASLARCPEGTPEFCLGPAPGHGVPGTERLNRIPGALRMLIE